MARFKISKTVNQTRLSHCYILINEKQLETIFTSFDKNKENIFLCKNLEKKFSLYDKYK